MPNIQLKLTDQINKFANTSIDISDGLLADLDKMINNQELSYKLFLDDIPISNNLKKILDLKSYLKLITFLMVMIIRSYLRPQRINEESLGK